MTEQLGRVARVTAYRNRPGVPGGFVYSNPTFFENLKNGIEFTEQFEIEFEIEKTLEKSPNTCLIKISNLAENTRNDLARLPMAVRFEAGFDGEYHHLFTGDMVRCFSDLKGPKWITTMQVGDASRSLGFARAKGSYARGTRVVDVLRDVARSMGVKLPPSVEASQDLQAQFSSGYSPFGPAREEISRLLAPYGFTWSIQDGRFYALKEGDTNENRALLIDNFGWLIGSPEYETPDKTTKPTVVKFESMLYSEIVPGRKIRLVSRSIDAQFKAQKVRHKGNTFKGDFKTEVEARVL